MKLSKMADIKNSTERYLEVCKRYNRFIDYKTRNGSFFAIQSFTNTESLDANSEKLISIPTDLVEKLLLDEKNKCYKEMREFTKDND